MAIYGYARVSSREQNLDRQIAEIANYGVEEKITGYFKSRRYDRIY